MKRELNADVNSRMSPVYVHYLHGGKSNKIPWYDWPYVEAFLERWSNTNFAKSVRYGFKVQTLVNTILNEWAEGGSSMAKVMIMVISNRRREYC